MEDLDIAAKRVAAEIVRSLQPRTVLDASGSDLLLQQLRNCGIQAWSHEALSTRADLRCDLIACIGGDILAEKLPHIASAADTILFSPADSDSTPLLVWIERFSENGFVPDPGYDGGAIAPSAMLFRRAPAWPPEALRLFADSASWRESTRRAAKLESELAAERRLTQTLRSIQARISSDAQQIREQIRTLGNVDEVRLRGMETSIEELKRLVRDDSEIHAHLARLDRRILELNRGIQAMNGRVEGILASRTWKMLTALGGVILRLSGRKS